MGRRPGEWQGGKTGERVDEQADDGGAVGEISSGFCDAADIFLSDVGIRRLPRVILRPVRPFARLLV